MLNKLFQGIVYQFKDITGRIIGVINTDGEVVACTELSLVGGERKDIYDEMVYKTDKYIKSGYTYKPLNLLSGTGHIIFVQGEDSEADKFSSIMLITLGSVKGMYDERHDRNSFLKNVILDNILSVDIYAKAKELHFNDEANRITFLIKFLDDIDIIPVDIIQNMFPDKDKDYIISVGEKDIVLIKEMKPFIGENEPESIAKSIVDTVNGEFFAKVMVGIGGEASNIKELSRSFKEAQIAIEVGKVFCNDKNIVNYENLGIGRLIYQLPTTLCEIFLQEVFKKGSYESLDRESLVTIQSFFENNLNVSETSRKLFVHRNTLVYRLEKIKKLTGLDLREFEHAITFNVAMMVKKYLMSKPVKY